MMPGYDSAALPFRVSAFDAQTAIFREHAKIIIDIYILINTIAPTTGKAPAVMESGVATNE